MKNNITIQTKKENVVLKIEETSELKQIVTELKKRIPELKKLYKDDTTPILITGKVLKNKEMEQIQELIKKEIPVEVEFDSPKIDIAMPYIDYVQFGGKADTLYTRDFMKDVFSKGKGTTKAVVYTLGPEGSLVYDGKTFYKEPAVPVKVVDTMGAGDTYMSGFMNAICDGKPIQEAMKTGALWASETLQYFGPH